MNTIHPVHKPIRTTRSISTALAVAALAVAALTVTVATLPADAVAGPAGSPTATAACPPGWSSLPRASTYQGAGQLTDVRTGPHACFDRIVFDVAGAPSWFRVQYVENVYTVGEGRLLPLRGGAKLAIVLSVSCYDDAGDSTYEPADHHELTNVNGYQTFRQVATAGSFEGETTIGLGVRARLPFRVFTVAGPDSTSRIVVDVAHRW